MRNTIQLLLCAFFISVVSSAQEEFEAYSYVVVPQQFEFQTGKDQFRLNSLTRFLLREKGFYALYNEETSKLKRCNGLYVDVVKESAFLQTKVVVVFEDCNGNQVFTSREGKSKEKDHNKSYKEAIENAMASIPALTNPQTEEKAKKAAEKKRQTDNELVDVSERKSGTFHHNGQEYTLENQDKGFLLYRIEAAKKERVGRLQKTSNKGIYLFLSPEGTGGVASFDSEGNMIIEQEDASGATVREEYQRKE